ncbi:MAG: aldo/keto reductase, partial [Actinobacteria bacterium]|nr:aldo/keto reductase [Actinomycetota bacterium]
DIAGRRGATTHQVALAFLTRTAGVFTIPKASRVEHVEQNAAAGDLQLSEAELARIDRAFPAP